MKINSDKERFMALYGFRPGYDKEEDGSKRTPLGGRIYPGRSLFTDDFYDDRYLAFDEEEDQSEIWDLERMNIHHPEGLHLVGDELSQVSHYGKGPKGYVRSDRLIHEDVCEALKAHGRIDATDIYVTVDKGIVFLRGEIQDRSMKRLAGLCVESVPGVVDIFNELKIKEKR